jgi:uncharacterized protein YciI
MKYVLFYESDPTKMAVAQALFPEHRARLDAFHAAGKFLFVGPFEDPRDGAMGIFRSREAVDEFVAGDPFVLNGVVARTTIRGWRELYGVDTAS